MTQVETSKLKENKLGEQVTVTPPVLVFLDCSAKAIDMVGNNNQYSWFIHGARPHAIRITVDEMGWAAKGLLGDEGYAHFLSKILDGAAAKQGIDLEALTAWTENVRLVMLNSGKFDTKDSKVKDLFVNLFPKAVFFQADQQGSIQPIWEPGRPSSQADEPPVLPPAIEGMSIDELDLSVRARNCLLRFNIETVGDLMGRSRGQISEIPNFGTKSLQEVEEALARHSLVLRS